MTSSGAALGWLLLGAGASVTVAGMSVRPRWPLARLGGRGFARDMVALVIRTVLSRLAQSAHQREWEQGFERGVGQVAGMLASGHGLIQALESSGGASDPFSSQLAEVTAMVRTGVPLRHAMERWPGRNHPALLNRFRGVIAVHERTGAALARPLWTLVGQCHRRRELRERSRSQTTEARWTAGLLLALPPLLLAYFILVPGVMLATLVSTSVGRASVTYAIASWTVGGWLIRSMIQRAVAFPWSSGWREGR